MRRYWEILESIVAAGRPLSASEIAQAVSMPRATCYRLVAELAELKIIDDVDDRHQYVLGSKFVTLALLGKADTDVSRAVSSGLQKLANQFGETAFVARLRAGEVELVHSELPQDASISFIYPGLGKRPVHACSSAKAIVAFANGKVADDFLNREIEKFTSRTNTNRKAILADMEEVRRRGFAICDQEIDDGVVSVAVPVRIPPVGVVFSIGFVGPSKRMYEHLQGAVGPVLENRAQQVSRALRNCTPLEASRNSGHSSDDVCFEEMATGLLV